MNANAPLLEEGPHTASIFLSSDESQPTTDSSTQSGISTSCFLSSGLFAALLPLKPPVHCVKVYRKKDGTSNLPRESKNHRMRHGVRAIHSGASVYVIGVSLLERT